MVMLESSSPEVRAVACACLGDLAASHPPLQPYLTQVNLPNPLTAMQSQPNAVLSFNEQKPHAC